MKNFNLSDTVEFLKNNSCTHNSILVTRRESEPFYARNQIKWTENIEFLKEVLVMNL